MAVDGTKLDTIATSANNYTLPASPGFTNPTCSTPTSTTHVANKAYVDAAGGGCYSKCADSGTAGGGATPSCPAGYSSVDTWSERAGFGQYQWGEMNSNNHAGNIVWHNDVSWQYTTYVPTSYAGPNGIGGGFYNTGYGSGSGTTNYYNDCTACCAD